ncbi:MAG: sugar ABC transporter substrate-binding protein [Clostridium sp.]|uniref:sugar ABC transporter substrate-binding protein n=1 Tax=Clostridium sp. TaxID=1506 RepID=UPI003D6CAEAE
MRKILSITLIIALTMSLLTGCYIEVNDTSKATQKIKIGVCVSDVNDRFTSYLLDEMKNYSKSLDDVEVEYVDSKHDSNIELSNVKELISKGVDVIVVRPVDTDSSKPVTDIAKRSKIPIISIGTPFENPDDSSCYISSDSKQAAILEMEYLSKKMNFKGNVAIMMGTMGQEAERLRTQGFREVIAKYSNMKIVAEQTAEWDMSKGMALMESWLESGKEINVVASSNSEMAIGALTAIKAAGKHDKISVGGIDATPEALNYLKSGDLAVLIFQNAVLQARCAIDTAVKIAKGENVEKIVVFPNELVVPEDVDKYIAKLKK